MTQEHATQPSFELSRRAHERARKVMPGGVNSPVRAYKAVGRDPVTIREGSGARVVDIDGNTYFDYVGSYGPLILGHAPAPVVEAVGAAAARGMTFGMPTEAETALAEAVVEAVAGIDVVRFVNSGTEAVMSAIRLARAATDRPRIIKCTGCYHGHSDGLLIQAGSGATTLGVPSSPGVPSDITANTLLVPYNDVDAVSAAFAAHPDVAGLVVEPIAGNMGCVLPVEGYLEALRRLCDEHGAILVFDEVMSGFRVAYGGAQQQLGVQADLTCLGKIVGGGMPCAAYGGRADLMRRMAPDGPVYQAGTLSGNPLAMAAGLATLEVLRDTDAYERLDAATAALVAGLGDAAASASVPVTCSRAGSMACCFFSPRRVDNYEQACECDTDAFSVFFAAMLQEGVILPPSQFETWFVSTAHDETCIDETIAAAKTAFKRVAKV
ncbi:MAG: glutamate-1-semialdehyde-2,1-aminomutase [Phycisphaeraceae bacterium]|nr:glutamate-1-semialdehyde-2,1-aminomutase [Phycisphaeraceae bacterium]